MKQKTRNVRFEPAPGDPHSPTSTPIYQTSTFRRSSMESPGGYDYTRSGNPTRSVLESQLANLDAGKHAFAFSSGMAAIVAVLSMVRCGERVVCCSDVYGGTYRYLTRVLSRQGVQVSFVDAADTEAMQRALSTRPKLLLVETPTNPRLHIVDIESASRLCRRYGVTFVVDSSLMSPVLQRPLELGADVVVHSATKLLAGHGDVTAGAVITRDATIADAVGFYQNAAGNALPPFEAWLLLRGMETLAIRLDRQQKNASIVADMLHNNSAVAAVYYPGLDGFPGAALHRQQAEGAGCVLSFETGSLEKSRCLIDSTKLFSTTVSFGCVRSSICLPTSMSHASVPLEERGSDAFADDLVRLSTGIEDPGDLCADLIAAIAQTTPEVSHER